MAEQSWFLATKRYAVVTGANKGIGLEICRQLASQGIVVVLTSRHQKIGLEAIDNLKKSGLNSECLEFCQLDVTHPTTLPSLVDFIKDKFGKLDILVNNAGIVGAIGDANAIMAKGFPKVENLSTDMVIQTYEQAKECLETNYYGVKTTTQALLPLLKLSDSPRIINVSAGAAKLSYIRSERIQGILNNAEELTEEKVDNIVQEFLRDFKDGSFVQKGWLHVMSAYCASKMALNAYTRVLAKQNPTLVINCVCPGYTKTDLNGNAGDLPVEEGASRVVRLALVPHGAPSGLYYTNNQVTPF